jgi:hypothetical protein
MGDERATGIERPFRWSALPPRLQLAFVILATGDLNTRCRPNGLAPLFRNVSEAKFARAQRSRIAVSSSETPSTVHITIRAERLESSAETQPYLYSALRSLSAMVSQYFTRGGFRPAALMIVENDLRGSFVQLKVCAHLLDLRCLLFKTRNDRLDRFL